MAERIDTTVQPSVVKEEVYLPVVPVLRLPRVGDAVAKVEEAIALWREGGRKGGREAGREKGRKGEREKDKR